MSKIFVTLRNGETRELVARDGYSVMEIIRDAGIEDILAMCGGCCSCATCHVYVDSAFAVEVGAPTDGEGDLLDFSDHKTAQSRLSCQIKMRASLDGLRVTVAPEE